MKPRILSDSRRAMMLTVVATNKGVAVRPLLLTGDPLLGLLQGDVHVAVHRLQFACGKAPALSVLSLAEAYRDPLA